MLDHPMMVLLRPEPYTGKLVRTVLRGRSRGDVTLLPDFRALWELHSVTSVAYRPHGGYNIIVLITVAVGEDFVLVDRITINALEHASLSPIKLVIGTIFPAEVVILIVLFSKQRAPGITKSDRATDSKGLIGYGVCTHCPPWRRGGAQILTMTDVLLKLQVPAPHSPPPAVNCKYAQETK